MAGLGKLSGIVTLDAAPYTSTLKQMQSGTTSTLASIKGQFDGLKSAIGGMKSGGIGGLVSGLAGGLGGGAIGAGLQQAVGFAQQLGSAIRDFLNSGAEAIRSQDSLARRIGVTRDAAVSLQAIGSAAGMDAQQMMQTIGRVQQGFGQLRSELAAAPAGSMTAGGEAANALRRLGINAEHFASMRFDQQLTSVADGLSSVTNASDRAGIAQRILGEGARDLMPLLSQGSASFQRIQGYAREFGAVASESVVTSLRGTNSELRELRIASDLATQGLRVQAASGYQEAISGARNYREQLQQLRQLQPHAAEGARQFGSAMGTLQRTFQSGVAMVARPFQFSAVAAANMIEGPQGRAPRPTQQFTPEQSAMAHVIDQAAAQEVPPAQLESVRAIAEEWMNVGAAATRAAAVQQGAGAGQLQFIDQTLASLQQARTEAASGADPGSLASERTRLLNRDADQLVTTLQRQQAVFGMNAAAVQRYDLVARGASESQLRGLDRQLRAVEALAEGERQRAHALTLVQSARSPLQSLRDQVSDIRRSGINSEQQGVLIGRAMQPAMQAGALGALPQMLEWGSTEATSAINNASRGNQDPVAQLRTGLEVLAEQGRQETEIGRQILDAIRNNQMQDLLGGR